MAELSLQQLQEIDNTIIEFLFANPKKGTQGEPWAAGYKKDPRLFKKLIKEFATFKKELLAYFQKQYDLRWWLINYPMLNFADANPKDFNQAQWDIQIQQLAQLIEKHKKIAFTLGLVSLEMLQQIKTNVNAQEVDHATESIEMAKLINQTTQKRISQAIQDAQALNESRYQFESRLKPIFVNDDRAGLIAEDQALPEFTQGRRAGAKDADWQYKTWDGVQNNGSEVCGMVIGETTKIEDRYSNGLIPGDAHIGCRCWEDYSMIPDNPTL